MSSSSACAAPDAKGDRSLPYIECGKETEYKVYWRPTENGITEHWFVLLTDLRGTRKIIQYGSPDGIDVTDYKGEPLDHHINGGGGKFVGDINVKLRQLQDNGWIGKNYDVANHNCQHFVNALTGLGLTTTPQRMFVGGVGMGAMGALAGGPFWPLAALGVAVGLAPRASAPQVGKK